MGRSTTEAFSPLELHVLVALAAGPIHGYAIAEAVTAESGGALEPRAGSLYRVIARLVALGFAAESDAAGETGAHPGLPRRYYALTPAGRRALAAEARRLEAVAALAGERLRPVRGRS